MEPLKCKICGGDLIMDNSGEFAKCEYCGTRYQNELLQTMIVEMKGKISVDGIDNVEKLIKDIEALDKIGAIEERTIKCRSITQLFPADYRSWMMAAKYDPLDTEAYKRAIILAPSKIKEHIISDYNSYWSSQAEAFRKGELIDFIIEIIFRYPIKEIGIDTDANTFIHELISSAELINKYFGNFFAVEDLEAPSFLDRVIYNKKPKKILVAPPRFACFLSKIRDEEARDFILCHVRDRSIRIKKIFINGYTLILEVSDFYDGSREIVYHKMQHSISQDDLEEMIKKAMVLIK